MRVLLKFSGEVLGGKTGLGLDAEALAHFANLIKKIHQSGHELAIVTGGGNIMRGKFASTWDRSYADQMGMMATVINSMALAEALRIAGVDALAMSAVPSMASDYCISKARNYLAAGTVVLVAGGTSNPYFTTDSAAALRALELKADLLLKATKVDGIYDSDPHKNPNAKRFSRISFDEVLEQKLAVMDLTAMTLCRENGLSLRVCSVDDLGEFDEVISSEQKSTLVK
ncbi:MAG: UMP kinase [Bradymonadales bacterium]|jgi:uridylate kinase